jgi:hypothetical protein
VSFTLSTAMTLALAAPAAAAVKNFMAVINAGQEVPPTASPAFGNAFFTFDTQTNVLCYAISYSAGDLLGPESAAHIHGPASPGVDAPIVVGLPAGSPKQGCTPALDAAAETALKKGQLYVNIHTDPPNPGGEIRGQIIPVKGK